MSRDAHPPRGEGGDAPLAEYGRKRDFSRTPEPRPRAQREPGRDLAFVVQQHHATRMHWDFRLEFGGVLVSWAVPKGPSCDRRQKRLAVHVEDHPIEYGSFEGVIPEGEYGAGPVIVWDQGTYSPDEDATLSFGDRDEAAHRMRAAHDGGKISVTLRGQKLRGSWTLVKTAQDAKSWLLIKHEDRYADPRRELLAEERSVVSFRTLEEVRRGAPAPSLPFPPVPGANIATIPGARPAPMPTARQPMLATAARAPFSGPEWWFELKLDGVRLLAFVEEGRVVLRSRSGRDLTAQFPAIADSLARQHDPQMLIDGEVVAFDETGRPDFELLASRVHAAGGRLLEVAAGGAPILFYAFDLLYLDGHDLLQVPLYQRKALLRERLVESDNVAFWDHVMGEGRAAFEYARAHGLEGVVAKRMTARYEPGMRSTGWLKVKVEDTREFVVGGWSEGEGARRATFGSLLVGYYEGEQLLYAGSVGSGLDERTLLALKARLEALRTDSPPFADPERVERQVRPHWVRPELVVEVRFARWTRDRRLRSPVFVRLRADREPREVVAAEVTAEPVPAPEDERADLEALIAKLDGVGEEVVLDAGGHAVRLTNLGKELWPAERGHPAYTKRDMVRYYLRVSPWLLPHLRDRPLTLTRYPDGIHGEAFYQKHWEHELPPFTHTVRLWSSHVERDTEYIMAQNLATLLWLAQLAVLELHPWLSRINPEPDALERPLTFDRNRRRIEASILNYPDFMNFDLDPFIYSGEEVAGGEPVFNARAFEKTRELAFYMRDLLLELGLTPAVKTSGKTGLHVYVPVLRQYDYDTVRGLCAAIGRFIVAQRPDLATMDWQVKARTGKVFIDHNMNTRGKNMASIYSLRPVAGAPASLPLSWEELCDVYPPDLNIETTPRRLAERGDLWAGILERKQDLRAVIESFGEGEER